jgi:3-oxoacyl-[acyl-carrier-protein] synthase III
MSLLGVRLTGLASAVPERILTNADLEKMVDTNDEWIYSRTGIRERRIVQEGQGASDLAVQCGRETLQKAGISPAELDLIIVATLTPDSPLPATACIVQAELNAPNAAAFDLVAGCSGFVYGVATGSQFIKSGMYRNVLVIGVDVLSSLVDWQDRGTCVLFGDGAGSCLLQPGDPGEGVLAVHLGADGFNSRFLYVEAGGSKLPASRDTVSARQHYIRMVGNEIFKHAVREMENSLLKALEQCRMGPEDLNLLIPHQANLRIIDALRRRVGLEEEQVVVNIDRYGNTSAGSVPLALAEAEREGRMKKGDVVGLTAFGAGLTWGSVIIRW